MASYTCLQVQFHIHFIERKRKRETFANKKTRKLENCKQIDNILKKMENV